MNKQIVWLVLNSCRNNLIMMFTVEYHVFYKLFGMNRTKLLSILKMNQFLSSETDCIYIDLLFSYNYIYLLYTSNIYIMINMYLTLKCINITYYKMILHWLNNKKTKTSIKHMLHIIYNNYFSSAYNKYLIKVKILCILLKISSIFQKPFIKLILLIK